MASLNQMLDFVDPTHPDDVFEIGPPLARGAFAVVYAVRFFVVF